jgi:hypothetical protein
MNSTINIPQSDRTRRYYLIDCETDQYRWVGRRTDADGAALVRVRHAAVAAAWHAVGIEWIPETQLRAICDFPMFYSIVRCFSERAVKVLAPYIDGGLELLPLDGLDGRYVGVHCIRWIEGAVNLEGVDQRRVSIHSFNFVPQLSESALKDCGDVFGVPELITKLFVSDRFKAAVEQHGLIGLQFREVPVS